MQVLYARTSAEPLGLESRFRPAASGGTAMDDTPREATPEHAPVEEPDQTQQAAADQAALDFEFLTNPDNWDAADAPHEPPYPTLNQHGVARPAPKPAGRGALQEGMLHIFAYSTVQNYWAFHGILKECDFFGTVQGK